MQENGRSSFPLFLHHGTLNGSLSSRASYQGSGVDSTGIGIGSVVVVVVVVGSMFLLDQPVFVQGGIVVLRGLYIIVVATVTSSS